MGGKGPGNASLMIFCAKRNTGKCMCIYIYMHTDVWAARLFLEFGMVLKSNQKETHHLGGGDSPFM